LGLQRFAGQLADMGKTVDLDSADVLERAAGVGAAQMNRSMSSFRLWLLPQCALRPFWGMPMSEKMVEIVSCCG
jgi:hypothetical protein